MARGDARRDVELVEDDEDATAGAPPGDGTRTGTTAGDEPSGASHRTRRRLLVAGAALLALLVVGAVVAQSVVTSRERARMAAVAGLPGVVDPADGPMRLLRTSTDGELLMASARTPDGLLVASRETTDGAASVVAFDPADGAVAWEVELIGPGSALDVLPDGEVVRSHGACETYGTERDLLVCLADNGADVVGRGTLAQLLPTETRLVVLDARDGSVVTDLSAAAGEPLASRAMVVLADLVVLAGTGGSTAQVRAVAADGSVTWQTSFPTTTTTADGSRVDLRATSDAVALLTPDALRLIDASGETRQQVALASDTRMATASGYAVAVTAQDTVVVRPDGIRRVAGTWVRLTVDDGSAPGLVLTSDERGLHAWDVDGRALWTSVPKPTGYEALLLDGRVLIGNGTALDALDAGTGEPLWHADGLLPDSGTTTDGRYVLVLAPRPGGSAPDVLVALDATDGQRSWAADLSEPVSAILPVHGVLVAYSYDVSPDGGGLVTHVLR
ncbi:outer membrane protein assembly factor BamB family protein [Cellulomonas dongxiuzhuiae]|uniref:PQQ-like beta-propeller repeat protein n=1 Tax=Cellulomonas dongxiuzhuiae TaxID=2819979 RepID=A0ABX8GJQ0_9CELL|nr:PQQ-binding-like beta-propeller repeat protein [Cellulomonas dongxiuzhuiae]MBO3095154.1 PQQ-binding-like beta-propeller repeat protein [Cellulomonas dongxiuzhuiae]QWC16158.1 PQQ-like beta-propeller repeat protein [Cellulomonas dongxiuzhuiae]